MSQKSVTVTIPVATDPGRHNEINHPGASAIAVTDGHLKVERQSGTRLITVAIYAPSKWVYAVVSEGQQ